MPRYLSTEFRQTCWIIDPPLSDLLQIQDEWRIVLHSIETLDRHRNGQQQLPSILRVQWTIAGDRQTRVDAVLPSGAYETSSTTAGGTQGPAGAAQSAATRHQ